MPFPHGCGTGVNADVIKNISDSEFEEIGQSVNGKVFALKDKNHPLYKEEYRMKITSWTEYFDQVNPGKSKPTFEEYVAKNPLIFFKDPWNRWVVLGEYDYQLMGGCGKPVIYLYPAKPTEVTVQMTSAIKFDTTIPEYQGGWRVLANSDGRLVNLNNNSCTGIDATRFGSEYALEACRKNSYPYLYWSGRILDRTYPEITQGWVIEPKATKEFLDRKLNEVGFSKQEKNDFMEYWVPQLENVKSPYIRVGFFGNREMDKLAPMTIAPQPDSYYRLFLDWTPLSKKPTNELRPQTIEKVVRRGFTVVEWGGLKK